MITLELDENNNIILNNGSFSFLENEFATAQDLARQLNLLQGENKLDIEEGINWDEKILGKMGGIDYIKSQMRARILKNEEVVNIVSLNVKKEKDVLNITSNINTIYGVITL